MTRVLSAALVVLVSSCHFLHLGAASLATDDDDTRVFVPDGKMLRHFVAGQTTTVADYYWLKLVMVLGGRDGPQPKILPLAHAITDLDPEYGYAYIAAGLALSNKKRLDQSIEILTKGAENAQRWEIPFYLAYNYWYEKRDIKTGAYWLRRASTIPGHPVYIEQLAARLYANAGDVDSALEFVETMHSQAPSDTARLDYEKRIVELKIERDLQVLERAIASYKAATGGFPLGLAQLPPIALSQPPDTYQYDPLSGAVSNRLLAKRLNVVHALDDMPRARESKP